MRVEHSVGRQHCWRRGHGYPCMLCAAQGRGAVMVFMHVVVLHRTAVHALATRRAREAIQLAQERLRAMSHALPGRLIKITNYGRASASGGGNPDSAGLASAETAGGTGRVGGTGQLTRLSTALSEFAESAARRRRRRLRPRRGLCLCCCRTNCAPLLCSEVTTAIASVAQ